MIHVAGPFVDGAQECTRCGYPLVQSHLGRHGMEPDRAPFAQGVHVDVVSVYGKGLRYTETAAEPTCQTPEESDAERAEWYAREDARNADRELTATEAIGALEKAVASVSAKAKIRQLDLFEATE